MRAYGSDRFRIAGEQVILHSALSKGWTARRRQQGTHAEFPGTTVLWDERYFEVVAAEPSGGGVRYVLQPWRDDHVIRLFEHYDEAAEQQRIDDFRAAEKQRRTSVAARFSAMFLGHLPADVQTRLANDLGLFPARMTIISTIPGLVLVGICAALTVDAKVEQVLSPVPTWLWAIALFMLGDSAIRFHTAMLQNRGMGSLPGCILYFLFNPRLGVRETKRVVRPQTVVPDDIARQDALTMRGPLLTLLSVEEQRGLAERLGFDHRQHAYGIAWLLLAGATLGAVGSWITISREPRLSAFLSLLAAGAIVVDQLVRLPALGRGPAASILAPLVRPFVRDLLATPHERDHPSKPED